ncbi:MAG: 4-hydroxy-3-methylbut-2-enyl diphosphate reductase, partial [Sulfuricurvum sp.]|nr:4-hydroxy-3-methylbut-2-enyl diphosphate reductase [Sulfuricurvum sp.]
SIAQEYCPNSYHIESEEDLKKEWFDQKEFCGISAGASTPDWIIDEVIAKINKLKTP